MFSNISVIKLYSDSVQFVVLRTGSTNSSKRSDSKERFSHKVDVTIIEHTETVMLEEIPMYILRIIFSHLIELNHYQCTLSKLF